MELIKEYRIKLNPERRITSLTDQINTKLSMLQNMGYFIESFEAEVTDSEEAKLSVRVLEEDF